MKYLAIIVALLVSASVARAASCGSLAPNPLTGLLDCVGSATGTVSNVTGTSPINVATGTTTPVISCATCVTSAASLTSTLCVTGAGGQGSQTPSANCTVDSSGNLNATTLTAGASLGFTGYMAPSGVTSGLQGFTVPDIAGTPNLYILPQPSSGGFWKDTGVGTCGTFNPSPAPPSHCENITPTAITTTRNYGGGFVNGGSTITTSISIPVTVTETCTIVSWDISIPAADTGTGTVKFLRTASGTASPGSGNSINTSGVSLATGTHIHSTTLSDFTSTAITAGDIIAVSLTTVGGSPTGMAASFECQRTL